MPPSSPAHEAITTLSRWPTAWTAACPVLQATTVRKSACPLCQGNVKLVSTPPGWDYFFFINLILNSFWISTIEFITQDGSVYLLPGTLSPLTWTTTLTLTAYALLPPPGADARRGFTVHQGPLSLYLALQELSAMQPVRNHQQWLPCVHLQNS